MNERLPEHPSLDECLGWKCIASDALTVTFSDSVEGDGLVAFYACYNGGVQTGTSEEIPLGVREGMDYRLLKNPLRQEILLGAKVGNQGPQTNSNRES